MFAMGSQTCWYLDERARAVRGPGPVIGGGLWARGLKWRRVASTRPGQRTHSQDTGPKMTADCEHGARVWRHGPGPGGSRGVTCGARAHYCDTWLARGGRTRRHAQASSWTKYCLQLYLSNYTFYSYILFIFSQKFFSRRGSWAQSLVWDTECTLEITRATQNNCLRLVKLLRHSPRWSRDYFKSMRCYWRVTL